MKFVSNRKKIVCTVTNDLITDQRMQRIATTLQENGYDVTLVGRELKDKYETDPYVFNTHRIKCLFNNGFLFYAEYNVRLFLYLIFHSYDIINSVDLDTVIAGIFASKIMGKKVVLDAHEDFIESPEIVNRPKVKRFWSLIEKFAFSRVQLLYTVSGSIAEKFSKRYNREVGLIRNMPESKDRQVLQKKSQKFVVLYQGALNIGRAIPQLIEAFQELDMELWLAGDGDLKADILRQIDELGIQDKVKYLGKLKPEELRLVTQQADLGVNLLEHLGESYYYSLANKFFDYVMAEIPQVCIDFPEYRRLNTEFEVAVLLDNVKPLTIREKLQNLRVNSTLLEKLTSNCRLAKKSWNWETEEKKLIEYYQAL